LSLEHRLLQQHNAILLRLALSQQQPELSFEQTIQRFTKEVGDFLAAQRVSVWIYNHDRSCMRCLDIYDAQESSHTSGHELEVKKFPQFIAALEEERFIAAADAASDVRTAEFVNSTRTPYSIFSMLASPIRVQRAVRGVMYCEHVGTGRKWAEEQQHFLASVTDLLSVSIATHDMRRTEETMLALLESAAQGVIAVDEEGKISVVNSLVEKMFGYDREEILRQPLEKLIPEELSDNTLEIQDGTLSRSSNHRIGSQRYFSGFRKDGEKFPVEIALSFVKQDGEHLALALVTDVTNRVAAEKKLQQSEELYRNVVEDQTDLISRCTPAGIRTFVNKAYCEYHDKSPEELLGSSIYDVIPPRDRKKVRESFANMTPENPIYTYEYRVLLPDGKLALNQWLDHAIFDDSGKLLEIQSIGRDITKQREAETRLREAQRLESIAVLASGIAHDFNNLLTPILIYTEGLRTYFADGSVESSQVLQILAAANRAQELVRQILTFGRESDELERTPTSIAPIIQDTLSLLRASVPKHIHFEVSVDSECGTVEADPSELYQILSNLCTNACHAMPAGGTLNVSATEVALNHTDLPSGQYVQVFVQDTGAGISPDHLEKIFDPFFTTKPAGEGTGLGLSVVHGAVTSLGGRIEVQSQSGNGTTFVVYLPCTDKSPLAAHKRREPAPTAVGTEHLLVVDDERVVLESTQFMLQQLGYQVTACASANEALTCFSADPTGFDLVLSDMTMPRTSGVELLRRVREQRREIPVVLMTGFAGLLNEEELKRFGIDEFIIKPLSAHELGGTIRRCLDQAGQQQAATSEESDQQVSSAGPSHLAADASILIIDDDQMVRNAMIQLLNSLGYKPLAAASLDEATEQLANRAPIAVLVDHHLGGEDGFAAVANMRKQATNGEHGPPLFIGMTGSGVLEEPTVNQLDGYLVKPFSAEELREVLEKPG
ncbi:MAG: hybrid sensor histidine kinase/response regulator, partial [Bythopirellula sp.]